MPVDLEAYRPVENGPTALFLDTSGLFAYFHPDAEMQTAATAFMDRIAAGEFPYRPLFTSTYVVDELITLLQSKGRHEWAVEAYETLTSSESITVLRETEDAFSAVGDRLTSYTDHEISFTDHLSAVQMNRQNVDHVFAYDGDYETFGFHVVPR